MQAQQAMQVSMQQQQAEFLGQQAIFMQQMPQQMGPTTQDKQSKQTKQYDDKQQHGDKQGKQTTQSTKDKQNKQKIEEEEKEDDERQRLGVVGSSSATAVAQQGAHSQRCAAIGPSLYPVR